MQTKIIIKKKTGCRQMRPIWSLRLKQQSLWRVTALDTETLELAMLFFFHFKIKKKIQHVWKRIFHQFHSLKHWCDQVFWTLHQLVELLDLVFNSLWRCMLAEDVWATVQVFYYRIFVSVSMPCPRVLDLVPRWVSHSQNTGLLHLSLRTKCK